MLEAFIQWLDSMGALVDHPGVLSIFAGGALLEYLFPPFPGDTATLLGATFVTAYSWSPVWIFLAVMLGSTLGSYLAFVMGRRWQRPAKPDAEANAIDRLVRGFERHGHWYLLLNRFLPGVRPLFFVAAGMAGMRTGKVMLLATISSALWNGLLMIAGAAIGANLQELQRLLSRYSVVAWSLLALIAGSWILGLLWNRRPKS